MTCSFEWINVFPDTVTLFILEDLEYISSFFNLLYLDLNIGQSELFIPRIVLDLLSSFIVSDNSKGVLGDSSSCLNIFLFWFLYFSSEFKKDGLKISSVVISPLFVVTK